MEWVVQVDERRRLLNLREQVSLEWVVEGHLIVLRVLSSKVSNGGTDIRSQEDYQEHPGHDFQVQV